ncbi:hypothetical protein ACWFNE_05385 [Cellulomonas sp. NPDC055163]
MRPTGRTLLAALAGVTLLVGTVTACGADEEPAVERPEGAVALQVNVPTPVEGLRVIAYQASAEGARIDVSEPGGTPDSAEVAVGDGATVGGLTFELLEVDVDGSEQPAGEAGGDGTTVWILPE